MRYPYDNCEFSLRIAIVARAILLESDFPIMYVALFAHGIRTLVKASACEVWQERCAIPETRKRPERSLKCLIDLVAGACNPY